MKKMWPVFVILLLTFGLLWLAGTAAIAKDQCDVVGNSYTITLNGDEWTLTDFSNVIAFSPAPPCGGNVSLVSPDGVYSYHKWCVSGDGFTVLGFPAVLTTEGLKLYSVPTNLYTLHVGNMTYMTEQEVQLFLFK